MTRKYIEQMNETNKQQKQVYTESSNSSDVEEPESPRIKTYKPLNSPPILVLDPELSDNNSCCSNENGNNSFFSSIIAFPVKKLISKKSFNEKKKMHFIM